MIDTLRATTTFPPAWEVAQLFPLQGQWSEQDYLVLTGTTNRLVELSEGMIEVLAMPTRTHQRLLAFLFRLMYESIEARGLGNVFVAALRVRLWEGKMREPDVVVMLAEHREREGEQYFDGADVAVEIVSPDDPGRDLVTKRAEYAQAGIPEYWIIEPQSETATVLQLDQTSYREYGVFNRGTQARSALLPNVVVDVDALFNAAH